MEMRGCDEVLLRLDDKPFLAVGLGGGLLGRVSLDDDLGALGSPRAERVDGDRHEVGAIFLLGRLFTPAVKG